MAKRIPFQRQIELVSVSVLLATLSVLVFRLSQRFAELLPENPWWAAGLAGLIVLGYVAADFVSGFVHFLGDTFCAETTPILGPAFIKPFRDHHLHPEWITAHDFFEVNANNSIVSLPFAAFAHVEAFAHPFATAFILFFLLGIFGTNQFHKWAHRPDPPKFVRWLQSMNLILSPKRHAKHHVAPYQNDFCITTGWMNPLLRWTRFYGVSRRVLSKILPVDHELLASKKVLDAT